MASPVTAKLSTRCPPPTQCPYPSQPASERAVPPAQISSDPALGGNPHATTFGRVYPVGLPRRSPACPGGLDGGAEDPRLAPYMDLVRRQVGSFAD